MFFSRISQFKLVFLIMFVFFGCSNSANAADGDVKWSFKTGSRILSSPAIANDGTIYIGSWDHSLYALNPDGSLKWSFETGNQISSSPTVASDGTIYFGSNDGKLYALDANGLLKWSYQTGDNVSTPSIGSDGTVYVESDDDYFYAINSDGTLKWSYETGRIPIDSPSIAPDGTIYASSGKNIIAMNPDGTLKWSYETDFFVGGSAAIAADGTIYKGSYDGKLYALDPDGNLKWEYRTADIQQSSPVIAKDGTIYIGGDFDGRLTAINPDGTMKWTILTSGGVNYAPAIASDGTVYFGSQDGTFYAVNPEDGSTKWTHKTDIGMFSSPAIAPDGTVYIGSSDTNLYAFEGSAGLMYSAWPKFGHNNRNTGTLLQDSNSPANAFFPAMLEDKTFVVYDEVRDTWIPNYLTTYRFSSDGNALETSPLQAGYIDTFSKSWAIVDGDIILSSGESEAFYNVSSIRLVDLFGALTAGELEKLRDTGVLTSSQVGVMTKSVETWTLLTKVGAKLKIKIKVDTNYELELPTGVTLPFYAPVKASESFENTYEATDLSLTSSELNSKNMVGNWIFYLQYSVPNYGGGEDFSGFMAESLVFNQDGTANGEISGTTYSWSIEAEKLTILSDNLRYEISSFFKHGSQYLVHTSLYIDDVLSEEYSDLVSKYDDSASTFIDNLVTEMPDVYSSELFSASATSWNGDTRLFENIYFAHQFSSNGDMLFGISSDVYTDLEKPQFSIPSLTSSYSIVDGNVVIRRNLDSDTRYGIRTWVPISTDEYGRTYVFERGVRFDSVLGNINDHIGAGYLIKPRINVFSKLDLSAYEEEYANSQYDGPDYDQDGIADLLDLDDDNDGAFDRDDAFPFDASESLDTDLDGVGNNADNDDDNDGIPDTYELSNGLDSLDASDGALDNDNDGLSNYDEFRIGTNINSADTDGDGIHDSIDNNPLDFDVPAPTLYSGQLSVLPDMNDDGISEIGILKVDTENGLVTLEVLSGKDQSSLKVISWTDSFEDSSLALHVILDINNNGTDEVGLFGIQDVTNNEGKPQVFVRDLQTGNRVSVLNWPANWSSVSALVIPDMTGDGIQEVGIQGRFKEGSRPQLVVKDGVSGAPVDTFSYPNILLDPVFNVHSDVDGDGIAEISTFGRIARNNKIQVKIANGMDSKDRLKAYNYPDKWSDISWHRLDDMNGDGEADWGLLGRNREDGRIQLIVKSGVDPRGALAIYAWPQEIQSPSFFSVADMNGDGVDEVAVAGVRSNNGRHQFQIKDGQDRNVLLANLNLSLTLTQVSYHVLPDCIFSSA